MVTAEVGSDVRIDCDVEGKPKPDIVWVKFDSSVDLSVLPNGTLVLQNIQQEDSGTYQCFALGKLMFSSNVTAVEKKGKVH